VRVLGVVTARGGSKGIPGKNLKPLGGQPLIWHTLQSAAASRAFDRTILSTDDRAIAEYAQSMGCEVPFMRPPELARDQTPHLPVMEHAVRWMADHEGYRPDAVMILQPTAPLRRTIDIIAAVRLLASSTADSVVGVSPVSSHVHPLNMVRVGDDGTATLFVSGEPLRRRIRRRQDLPPAWVINGAIYIFRPATLTAAEPSLYGERSLALPIPEPYGLSLDHPEDWGRAEQALAAERSPRSSPMLTDASAADSAAEPHPNL
jgi:CMP-N-acetylneuraminic acid synthetase